MVHEKREGGNFPGSLRSPDGRPVLWDCTVAEISPSAITPASGVNPRDGHGIGLLFGCVGSEGVVPESVTEPPGKGSDLRQPANARRLALESSTVPVPLLPDHYPESTTESSLENPPATDK